MQTGVGGDVVTSTITNVRVMAIFPPDHKVGCYQKCARCTGSFCRDDGKLEVAVEQLLW